MEIINVEELKYLIREIVKEEIGDKEKPSEEKQKFEKPDNNQQIDEVRNRIQHMSNSDEARAIPSTPLSPGIHSANPTPIDDTTQNTPPQPQPVDDMEI